MFFPLPQAPCETNFIQEKLYLLARQPVYVCWRLREEKKPSRVGENVIEFYLLIFKTVSPVTLTY